MMQKSSQSKTKFTGYFFISPAVIFLFIFSLLPIIMAFIMMFYRVDANDFLNSQFRGLQNFQNVLGGSGNSEGVWKWNVKLLAALWNTFRYVIIVVPIQTMIALILASLLNAKIKAKRGFVSVMFLPTLTSSAAMTLMFMWIFAPTVGIVSKLFSINLLLDSEKVLYVIMGMNIFSTVPLFMTVYLAGLQDIPTSLYEAAKLDGAGPIRQFFSITVPQLKPITFYVLTMSLIGCFQVFDQAFIISNGSGGPNNGTLTLTLYIYQLAFPDGGTPNFGMASALAFMLALLIFVVSALLDKFMKADKIND